MLMYTSDRVNDFMRTESNNKSQLFLMGGEVPKSVTELAGKTSKDFFEESLAVIDVNSRKADRFTQFLHSGLKKRVFGMRNEHERAVSFHQWIIPANGSERLTDEVVDCFNKSSHSDLILKTKMPSSIKFHNEGYPNCTDAIFSFKEPRHMEKFLCNMYMHYTYLYTTWWGGADSVTDFEQVDNTLDLTGVETGNTVRIRDPKNLPAELNGLEVFIDGVVEKTEDGWKVKGLLDSFTWEPVSTQQNLQASAEVELTMDAPEYKDSNRKYRYYRMAFTGANKLDIYGNYILPIVSEETYPEYDTMDKPDVTWAVYIPNLELGSYNCDSFHVGERSGNAPIMMVDAGAPNEGKAVTLNLAKGVDHTSDITLMNLKTFIGWMES